MLRKIKLTNFKCFERLELNCSPLTLLCGLNGMGKSSVIQALLVLRQSFVAGQLGEGRLTLGSELAEPRITSQARQGEGRLVLGGELADIGTGQDVLFEGAETDVVEFELHREDIPTPYILSFDYSSKADQLVAKDDSSSTGAGLDMPAQWGDAPPLGGNLIYISADRVGPQKIHSLSDAFARIAHLGVRGEYVMNYLNAYQNDILPADDPRAAGQQSRSLLNVVDRWLQEVTPGAHLQFETITNADALIAGFSFDRRGDVRTRRYRATNVGFGLSYVLPVLTGLLASPGTLCLIENPEAHLHPKGQTKLAELAVRASLAGVQVIAETHSDHFMDGVRIAVRDGLIQPNETTFHYFDFDGNKAVVSSPQVDADGRLSSWPTGFFDQREENLARLLAPKS